MAILGVLEAKVKADTKQFDSSLKKSKGEAKQFADATDRNIKKASKVMKGLGKAAGVAGAAIVAGLAVGAAAIMALGKAYDATVPLAIEQEDAEIRLAGVLKATKEAAGFSLEELKNYASQLQKVTTVGDETTIAAMSMLATFKEIKGDQFKEATKAAIDMSAVMKTDLKSSIIQVGKALNDPAKGMAALSRSGVSFTEDQKKQVKALQASGDMMGAQMVILNELKGEFGGVAEALRGNFNGALISTENTMGDLKEEIGFTVTKNNFFIESLKIAETTMGTWTKSIQENRGEWMQLSKAIGIGFIEGIGIANTAVRGFYNAWKGLVLIANGAVIVINTGLMSIVETTRTLLFKFDLLFAVLEKVGAIKQNPFDNILDGLQGFNEVSLDDFTRIWDEVEAGNAKFDKVSGAIESFKNKIKDIEAVEVDPAAKIGESVKRVEQELKEIGGVWVNVQKDMDSQVTEDTEKTYTTMEDGFADAVKQMEADAHKSVAAILADIEKMKKPVVIPVTAAEGHATGGPIGFATGGQLPGFGGGDRIPALLEAGEFIIRKEAVSKFGSGIFSALNNMQIPGFAVGGAVGSAPTQTLGHYTHDINFMGSSQPVRVTTDQENAAALVRGFQRMEALAS